MRCGGFGLSFDEKGFERSPGSRRCWEGIMNSGLPMRFLGSSGIAITVVGFGAWAAGGGGWSFSWGPQDDSTSIAAMRRALELGVNWIDTAAVYGLGHSEEVVGRLLHSLRPSERPLVFTKCGLI
jgi:aryl-alcohol dehydrogenase-like predicted oxidoreductase